MTPAFPVILFDGHCLMCSGAVRWIHRRDPRMVFRFAAQQSPEGESLLRAHPVDTHGGSLVVVIPSEARALAHSDAALFIAAHLTWPWRWLSALRIIPRFLRDWLYVRVARNRYRFAGTSETCFMPDEGLRQRFVLE